MSADPIEAVFVPVLADNADPATQARIDALVVTGHPKSLPSKIRIAPPPTPGREWEKLKGETEIAYAAFLIYRGLDPGTRTISQAARQGGRSLSNYHRFSLKYHWIARVAAWDAYLERQREDAERERLVRQSLAIRDKQQTVINDQLIAAQTLKFQALRVIRKQGERDDKMGGPDAKILELASRTLERAVELERLAVGLPTDVSQQSIQLKKEVAEAFEITDTVKAIMQEQLCDECKARVTNELRRLARRQRAVADRLQI